jgi:hypothetical protein
LEGSINKLFQASNKNQVKAVVGNVRETYICMCLSLTESL